MPTLYSVVFILTWKANMGAKSLAHSSLSLLPSPLPFSPPLPLPPSPTLVLPAVFSCFFANGQMRTQHKLGKCSTAETQPQPSSQLKDIYKVPSTVFPLLQVFFPSLCFVLVSFLWLWDGIPKEQLKGERASFSSRFQGTAQHSRGVREQGLGAVGSILFRPESRERRRMLVLSSRSLLTRGTAWKLCHHVDRSSYISQCNQDRHTQSPVSRVILDSVRFTVVKRPSRMCSSRSRSKSRNGHLSVFILIVF